MISLLKVLLTLLSEMLFVLSLDCKLAQHHCALLNAAVRVPRELRTFFVQVQDTQLTLCKEANCPEKD